MREYRALNPPNEITTLFVYKCWTCSKKMDKGIYYNSEMKANMCERCLSDEEYEPESISKHEIRRTEPIDGEHEEIDLIDEYFFWNNEE